MVERIASHRHAVDRAPVFGNPPSTVRGVFKAAILLLSGATLLSGCTARYVLGDGALREASKRNALNDLGVYVSNRTIPVYERDEMSQTRVGREIEDRSRKGRLRRPIGRNATGLIVGEDLRNGARRLWISFSRTCRDNECAYGFVQTEDGRYRLVDLPEREDYEKVSVFRSCMIGRHEMKHGKLKALSDANPVYRLERKNKKRPKTVFLEVKRSRSKRTDDRSDPERGN